MKELISKNDIYEKKIPELSFEIKRLTEILKDKAQEAEIYKKKASKIDEIQMLFHRERDMIQSENKKLKEILGKNHIEYGEKNDDTLDVIPSSKKDYEKKISLLEEELDRVIKNYIIQRKINRIVIFSD